MYDVKVPKAKGTRNFISRIVTILVPRALVSFGHVLEKRVALGTLMA